MARKSKDAIAGWVAQAVGETISIEGPDDEVTVSARWEANEGDYQRVSVRAPDLEIPAEERFTAEVADRTIQFMVLESLGEGEYLLRVRID